MSANSDYVLRSMLAEYQRRIAAGVPKQEALKFDGSFPGLWDVASELKAENLAQVNILGEVFMSEVTFLRLEAEENARLAAEEQAAKMRANQEAQKVADEAKLAEDERKNRKHNYLVALFGVIAAAVFTLILEYLDEIIAFIKDFLH